MSVEPVTVVIKLSAPEFGADTDALARTKAAEELGLEENQIVCVSRGAAMFNSERLGEPDEQGNRERTAEATISIESTWAPAIVAQHRVVTPVAWPDIKLGRGSRWHGEIPDPEDNSKAIEATLISDGEKLVLIDSPEGRGILTDLRSHEWPTAGEALGE